MGRAFRRVRRVRRFRRFRVCCLRDVVGSAIFVVCVVSVVVAGFCATPVRLWATPVQFCLAPVLV